MQLLSHWTKRAQDATVGEISNGSVVLWTNVFILAIFAVFCAATFPRAVARFARRPEWLKGHYLHHTPESTFYRKSKSSQALQQYAEKRRVNPLPGGSHVQSLSSRFYKIGCLCRTRILPGYHTGRVLSRIFYFCILLFATLYRDSVFKNPARQGAVAASQLPLIYILATKNNVFSVMLGHGYEKLNFLHRFAGRLVVLAANVHAIGFTYKWVIQGVWRQKIAQKSNTWGLVALISMDILFACSLGVIRREYYNFFYLTHITGSVILLFATCLHKSFAIPYVAIAAGLYTADRIMRVLKSRYTIAHLQPIPDMNTTLLMIPHLNSGWRAGQHVRIRVLSRAMGPFGWTESHPYTIASACENPVEGRGMVLMVKRMGGWSRHLYDLSLRLDEEKPAYVENAADDAPGYPVRVQIQGPYGGPGNTMFSTFSGVLLVTGGSGVSFAIAVLQELLQKAEQGNLNTHTIEVMWSVHHSRVATPMIPLLTSLLARAGALGLDLTVQIFYTRALSYEDELLFPPSLPHGMSLLSGRAWVPYILSAFVQRLTTTVKRSTPDTGTGMIVGLCGPQSLGEDVRKALIRIDKPTRMRLGGVELHEEAFQW